MDLRRNVLIKNVQATVNTSVNSSFGLDISSLSNLEAYGENFLKFT